MDYSSGNWNTVKKSFDMDSVENVTVVKNEIYSFYWKIDRFGEFMDRQYEFLSPVFSSDLNKEIKWKMIAYPENRYPEGQHVAFRLMKTSKDEKSISVKYELAFLDKSGESFLQGTRERVFRHYLDNDECISLSNLQIKAKNLLCSDSLIICCKMDLLISENSRDLDDTFATDSNDTPSDNEKKIINSENFAYTSLNVSEQYKSIESENFKTNKSLELLSNDFRNLYTNKRQCDVTIRVDDGEIRAHRAVIASRSDYFRKANANSEIRIAGMKSIILDAALYYMYTGQLRQLTFELGLDLLKACSIFNLPQLEELIMNFLKTQINTINVIDVFQIAKGLGMNSLKICALKFISTNHLEVTKTDKWIQMMRDYPQAAGEILLTINSFQRNHDNRQNCLTDVMFNIT